MHIGIGLELIDRADNIRDAQAGTPRLQAAAMHKAIERHARIDLRAQARHTQVVTVAQLLSAAGGRGQVHVQHHAAALFIHAGQRCAVRVGLGAQATGQGKQFGGRGFTPQFVQRRATHLALDADGVAQRRNEDDITRQQAGVVAGVATDQEVIQVEVAYHSALPLELYVAQRAYGLDAARGEQTRSQRCQAADRVAARPLRLAQHKDADRADVAHRDIGFDADHLLRDAPLDAAFGGREAQPGNLDGPQLGEADRTLAADHKLQTAVLAAEQLHTQFIARPHHIVGRHGHIGQRCVAGGGLFEQVIAKRFKARHAAARNWQTGELDLELEQSRLGRYALRGLGL